VDLLPNAITHLSGNRDTQVWILGDEVADTINSLITSGGNAPIVAPNAYWAAVHGLARNDTLTDGHSGSTRHRLLRNTT